MVSDVTGVSLVGLNFPDPKPLEGFRALWGIYSDCGG